jgi:glycosyltransferase involved in cell wall biosynthesis
LHTATLTAVTPGTRLAVVGTDPRFRGGALAQMEAFWRGAVELGREPSFAYLAHPSLADVSIAGSPLDLAGTKAPFGRLDGANQLAAGLRLAPQLDGADAVWVVSTTAAHGYAAVRSQHPYSCWIGTGIADEWAGRRPGLPASRRLALRVNAPILRRLERRVLRGAARVYATSPWSRASVAHAGGLTEDEVGILPIPVDLRSFTPTPDADWQSTLNDPVLAFVGRADDSRKNVKLLLDALTLLPGVRLLLVGSAPRGVLPERVEATGSVAAVAPHLRRATLFVLPSFQEGFGIAAAEALAAGLPVVTTPCGGPEALITESGGGVVLSGFSPDELAGTVRGLLDDPRRLAEMRRAGRAHVEREHSPARFRELLEAALA